MADFIKALPTIFLHEGRYVDNKSDPGGATNYGISLRFLIKTGDLDLDGWRDGDINHDGVIDAEDIKALTKERAGNMYRLYFWDKNGYENISDQKIATKVFDLAVNMGSYAAHKVVQRATRSAVGVQIIEDGAMGQKTFRAIEMCKPEILMAAIKSEAAGVYRSIVEKKPNLEVFLKGWLNRSYSNITLEMTHE